MARSRITRQARASGRPPTKWGQETRVDVAGVDALGPQGVALAVPCDALQAPAPRDLSLPSGFPASPPIPLYMGFLSEIGVTFAGLHG